MPTRVEWHKGALADLAALDTAVQQRITDAVGRLRTLDNPTQRLEAYTESLRGYWKLRVGDFRLVCTLERDDAGRLVIIIQVVHRSEAYRSRNVRKIKRRIDG